jgi:tRNA-dihydrouridine synthase B
MIESFFGTCDAMPVIAPEHPWLAPMAGHTDLPFRLLCREHGCSVACTEMVSAKGLLYHSPETFRILETHPDDQPLVVQLFGREKSVVKDALQLLIDMGYVFFDLNAGCPVKKVVKSGAGAALLQDPKVLFELIEIMVTLAGPGRVGVKLRSGWQAGQRGVSALGPELERLGVAWITLHPRTKVQGFSGCAKWSDLRELKEAVTVPVIGSGDLLTVDDAVRCLKTTGIDGIMFARGALKQPMIFKEFQRCWAQGISLTTNPTRAQLMSVMQRHVQLALELGLGGKTFFRVRASLARYVRGIEEAKELRRKIMDCNSWKEIESLIWT